MGLSVYTKKRLYQYFKSRLGAVDYKKGWMKSDCPSCGKEFKFGINLGHNRTNCFRCGYHPTPVNLVIELEKLLNYAAFKDYIANFTGFHNYVEDVVEIATKVDLNLPEGFRILNHNDGSKLSQIVKSYIKGRGFNIDTLSNLGWGYCDKGDLFGYLIIPFFEKGQVVYYNARKIIGNGPRYKNPTTDDSSVGKSLLIYNSDALYIFDSIFLCEGAINAATLGERAISSSGKFISKYQHNLILKSPVSKVTIILDPDAKVKALETALVLSQLKKVRVVYLPEGKDINDLGKSITMQYIRDSPYLTTSQILQMKQRITLNEKIKYNYI